MGRQTINQGLGSVGDGGKGVFWRGLVDRLVVGRPAGCSAEGDSCGSDLPGWGRVGGVYQQSLVRSFPLQCCISGIFDRDFVPGVASPFHLMVYHG
jgi:hypothetical protein